MNDIKQKAAALLRNAATRLTKPFAWGRAQLGRASTGSPVHPCGGSAVTWCALGGLIAERGISEHVDPYDAIDADLIIRTAIDAVVVLLPPRDGVRPFVRLYQWNDFTAKQDEVPQVFRAAADALDQEIAEVGSLS
jgi:hypothetical protein